MYFFIFLPTMLNRDLNPNNILLANNCKNIKLIDFGIATVLRSEMTNGIGDNK